MPRRADVEPAATAPELGQHRLHQRRVERVADRAAAWSAARAVAVGRELGRPRPASPETTTDARAVDRRDADAARRQRPARSASLGAATATIAPPAGSACISRPRARRPARSVLQRQHPGHVRRGDLADRVAQRRSPGCTPARLPAAGTAPPRPRTAPAARRRSRSSTASPSARRSTSADQSTSGVQRRRTPRRSAAANTGNASYSSPAHARPLAALAGEQERQPCPPAPRAARPRPAPARRRPARRARPAARPGRRRRPPPRCSNAGAAGGQRAARRRPGPSVRRAASSVGRQPARPAPRSAAADLRPTAPTAAAARCRRRRLGAVRRSVRRAPPRG